MAPKKGTILYHYTDFLAADGILRGAQLRVNNVLRMNDSAEMRHFMNRLCSAVTEQLKRDGYEKCVPDVRNLFKEELKKEYSAYAACFSFHRDDAAQWERYGNQGRGVCIAFHRNCMERMAVGPLSLQQVFYQNDMAGHPMVRVFCELIESGTELSGENPEIKQALCDAWVCSVSFKHPSFASEYEMRLVVSPFEKDGLNIQPCYHVSKERIKGTSEKRPKSRKQGAKKEGMDRSAVNTFAIALIYMYSSAAIPEKGRKAPCHASCSFRPAIARR